MNGDNCSEVDLVDYSSLLNTSDDYHALVEQKRLQQIKAIDLIASWNPSQPEGEIGVAIAQWAMAGDTRNLWAIFEAALEDCNYASLIPVLDQAWKQWEKEDEIKQELMWDKRVEDDHNAYLEQQERDEFLY